MQHGYAFLIILTLLAGAVLVAGCNNPVIEPETGTIIVTSVPEGAEVYLDNEYRGTTPVTIRSVPAGTHQVELRRDGYERWSVPVTVTGGGTSTVPANLVVIVTTLPVTVVIPTVVVRNDQPRIHIDGFWTYPQRQNTVNPVPLIIHVNGDNVGDAEAREVTVAANLYYEGRMVCWNTVYLGTLEAGGHVSKDTMVSCTLPSGLSDADLVVKFENIVVTA